MYAVRKNVHDSGEVFRKLYAQAIWRATTAVTKYLVNGSGPHNFKTYKAVNWSSNLKLLGE
jgi:hypothetical protein